MPGSSQLQCHRCGRLSEDPLRIQDCLGGFFFFFFFRCANYLINLELEYYPVVYEPDFHLIY